MTTIGIPRALLYYSYHTIWHEIFRQSDLEVIVSPETNKNILDLGVKNCVDDACLPVKIFHGHVAYLRDTVDYIFVPKFISVMKGEYICPKFCGLPEMICNTIPNLPTLFSPEINLRKGKTQPLRQTIKKSWEIKQNLLPMVKGYKTGMDKFRQFNDLVKLGHTNTEAIDSISFGKKIIKGNYDSKLKIALLGHPYNIYDRFISMNIINKIRARGIEVITEDMIDTKEINRWANTLDKKMFWTFGRTILGAAMHLLDKKGVDGIIYLSSFGCGIDSVVEELVERWSKRENGLPFTLITVDEHTGEAGFDTRLEAFIDMIERRKNNEGNISSYGKGTHSNKSIAGGV